MKQLERVMFAIPNMHSSGAQRVVAILCNSFAKRNIKVCLCYTGGTREPSFYPLDKEIEVFYSRSPLLEKIKKIEKVINPGDGLNYYTKIIRLRRKIRQFKPQIIVAFMDYTANFILTVSKGLNIPVVLAVRNSLEERIDITKQFKDSYKEYSGIVYQTHEQKEQYTRTFELSEKVKQEIILNPVEYSSLWDKERKPINNLLIAVGREHEQKNYPLLLKAFSEVVKKYPTARLHIYGKMKPDSELPALAQELQIEDKVTFCGVHPIVEEKVNEAEIFIIPSLYEGIPNVLVEAMCLGLPCISTDFGGGGARELISNEENGLIVKNNDVPSMVEAILKLLSDKEYANSLGSKAKNLRERLDANVIAEQWVSFLKTISNSEIVDESTR